MHEHPAGPTGTPRCALARPGMRMAARGWLYRGQVPAVSWPGTGRIMGALALCRGVCTCSCARCAARLALLPNAVSQVPQLRVVAAQRPCRGHWLRSSPTVSQAQCRVLAGRVLGWLCCIVTQPSLLPLPPVTIHLGVLRYNA